MFLHDVKCFTIIDSTIVNGFRNSKIDQFAEKYLELNTYIDSYYISIGKKDKIVTKRGFHRQFSHKDRLHFSQGGGGAIIPQCPSSSN